MGEETEIPSPEEQKEILSSKLVKSVLSGETWYLISAKWLKSLKEFIGMMPTGTYSVSQPGPVDNRLILTEDLSDLKKGLAENVDYDLISEQCWNLITSWYGTCPDQKPIARKAVASGGNHTFVEIYLIELKCFKNFDMSSEQRMKVSKADMMTSLHETLRTKFEVPENIQSRLWMSYGGDKDYNLLNLNVSVRDSGICDNQSIILEVQSGGAWPRNGRSKSTAATNTSYFQTTCPRNLRFRSHNCRIVTLRPTRQTSSIHCNNPIKTPGICGLGNLGYTCFMNSVIQCLSNSPPLTEYFLEGQHILELNTSNPLGMKGEIAKAYGDLIKDMWSGRFACTNPLHFKVQVSKFNAQFCGCQQNDAQELLTFLLDGLHEDLNRIIKKPYVENKDYSDQEDHVVANEAWENYKKRNDSVIVDTFHGLLKSRVVCPQCERLSVTFDPFCHLSLPLPLKKERYLKIKFIPFDPTKRECLYRVIVPRRGTVKDLCKEVASKTNTDPSLLITVEISNSHFHKFYSCEENIDLIEDKDVIYVYETPDESTDSEHVIVPACFWELCQPNERFSQTHLFGVPFITVLPKHDLSFDRISANILYHMRRHFNIPDYNNGDDNVVNLDKTYVPSLYLLDTGVISNNYPMKLEFDENGECTNLIELLEVEDSVKVFGRKILLIQMTVEERREFFSELPADYGSDLNSSRLYSKEKGKLLIYDCLDLFTTCEKLGFENEWYCPTCKDHQRATKKFDLWKLPKILIIHLKRFSYARCGDKIDALVEFPIRELNLYKYVINPDQQHISYDLIGVINHYGTMAEGHYTAYCKNKQTNSWYCFDDNSVTPIKVEDIMTPTAYVLFYYRNDEKSPPDTPMDIN